MTEADVRKRSIFIHTNRKSTVYAIRFTCLGKFEAW